jgi:hypothetical protein
LNGLDHGILDAGVLGRRASVCVDRALRFRSPKQPEQFREVSVSRGGLQLLNLLQSVPFDFQLNRFFRRVFTRLSEVPK